MVFLCTIDGSCGGALNPVEYSQGSGTFTVQHDNNPIERSDVGMLRSYKHSPILTVELSY